MSDELETNFRRRLTANAASPMRIVSLDVAPLPAFNRLEFTKRSIPALLEHTDFPSVLTVVDNASTDGLEEVVDRECRRFKDRHCREQVLSGKRDRYEKEYRSFAPSRQSPRKSPSTTPGHRAGIPRRKARGF